MLSYSGLLWAAVVFSVLLVAIVELDIRICNSANADKSGQQVLLMAILGLSTLTAMVLGGEIFWTLLKLVK